MIRHMAILGTGLIGGSLGLRLRRAYPDLAITGFDHPEVLPLAIERGAITEGASSPQAAVRNAELVVLATPVTTIPALMEAIAPHLMPGALVTDVASVKGPVQQAAGALLPEHVTFIGGHPMAGKEYGGIVHADPLLFENAMYVLCPGGPEEEKLRELVDFLKPTGARFLLLDAESHDRIAATISHLPQLVAVALTNTAAGNPDPHTLQLAAGGFRDMTRIASSSFSLWRDILLTNRDHLLPVLEAFLQELQQYREALDSGNPDVLKTAFESASQTRRAIPRDMKGFLHPLADVYLYAEDRPGFLHRITGVLAEHGINIKDIELLKIREGMGGTFRLGFSTRAEAEEAVHHLQEAGYSAYLA